MKTVVDERQTAKTRARWDRNAKFYDWMTRLMEGEKARAWHTKVWGAVKGERVLEVGVGTGRSLAYYPAGLNVMAIDLSS